MRHDAPDWLPEWFRKWWHFYRGCHCCMMECEWDNIGCGYCLDWERELNEGKVE